MLTGSIVALITPFNQDKVDTASLERLVDWHIEQGTQGIVPLGSTGEGVLVTPAERQHILATVIKTARGRIPVIAGCSSPSTAQTAAMVSEAQNLGMDAALVVTPYYVKPSPEGIFQHFQVIGSLSSLPVIIYNNPGRSGVDLSVELITRLATIPAMVGLKDSSTDLARLPALRQAISKPFSFISGDDPTAGAYMEKGGDGCISITANVAPRLCQAMMAAWKMQHIPEFDKLRNQLMPLHEVLLTEINPCPVKFGVSALGMCRNEVRLPLVPVSRATETHIKKIMKDAGLIDRERQ